MKSPSAGICGSEEALAGAMPATADGGIERGDVLERLAAEVGGSDRLHDLRVQRGRLGHGVGNAGIRERAIGLSRREALLIEALTR